jgi:hypothetical protein
MRRSRTGYNRSIPAYEVKARIEESVVTAHVWAEQQHQFQAAGKAMPVEDSYITRIARRHSLAVVT